MSVNLKSEMARLAINKSLLKEFKSSDSSRVVYMNNGDEFQIELFNSEDYRIGAKIYLNGESLSDTLVIRPGERIWLERYLDKAKKFKFSTYEVEDGDKQVDYAIRNNGEVKIEFFKEKLKSRCARVRVKTSNPDWSVDMTPSIYYYNSSISDAGTIDTANMVMTETPTILNTCFNSCTSEISAAVSNAADAIVSSATNFYAKASDVPKTKETGRVDVGAYSNQKFDYVDIDFEYYPFQTEIIKILPMSRKPYTSSDLKKKYCPNCGRKITDKYKFCPFCGEKLD